MFLHEKVTVPHKRLTIDELQNISCNIKLQFPASQGEVSNTKPEGAERVNKPG